jgi:hypothetical protein
MDGRPLLSKLAQALHEHGLEAILIGNAAAALNGVPVSRVSIEFLFRKTPANLRKLTAVAKTLGATVWRATYPVSNVRRLAWDGDCRRINFLMEADGATFERKHRRAQRVDLDGYRLCIARTAKSVLNQRALFLCKERG